MDNSPDPAPEPANLRFLRGLVTVLTGVMIVGLVTLIVLFVMRFPAPPAAVPLPGTLELPAGTEAVGLTYTPDRILVVTRDDRVLVLDRGGRLVQTLTLR